MYNSFKNVIQESDLLTQIINFWENTPCPLNVLDC